MKTIKGDLILKENTVFEESIKVEGDILGRYNLTVKGDINAMDINAWNINAMDINAMDINAWDIICEKRIKKSKDAKTICRVFIQEKSKIERGEKLI